MLLRLRASTLNAATSAARRALSTAAAPAAGKGRSVLGIVAGGTAVIAAATCDFYMMPLSAKREMPWVNRVSTAATVLLGCYVNRLVAPPIGMLGYFGRAGLFFVTDFFGGAALMLNHVDRAVSLTQDEKANINEDLRRYRTDTNGSEAGADWTYTTLLLASKAMWLTVEEDLKKSGDMPKDEQGRAMLTRKGLEAFVAATVDTEMKEWKRIPNKETVRGMKKAVLLQVFSLADVNNNGAITFPEFFRAFCFIGLANQDEGVRAELCFETLDVNSDGAISMKELHHFVSMLQIAGGIPAKDAVWTSLFEGSRPATATEITMKWMKRFDINNDGSISREEFCKMAKHIDFQPAFFWNFDRTKKLNLKEPNLKG